MATRGHQNWQVSDSLRDFFTWRRYKRLLSRINRHELLSLSGSIAYTTALALSPFLIITISIFALTNFGTQQTLNDQIQNLVGPEAARAVKGIIDSAAQEPGISGLSGVLGFLVLLFSASAIFAQLRLSLDKIVEYKAPKSANGIWAFIKERIFSVGLVLGFVFLMIVSLGLSSMLSAAFPIGEEFGIRVVSFFANLIVFSLLFSCMFHFIPTERLPWGRCLVSGVVACGFFLVGKSLIGLYLGNSALGSAYGAAGSFIVLLVWIYYTSLTLLISFEFTNTVVLENRLDIPK